MKEKYDLATESLMNIPIFGYTEVEVIDDYFLYRDPVFHFESLQEFNGMPIMVTINWNIVVYDDEGETIKEFNIFDVPEFRDILKAKISEAH